MSSMKITYRGRPHHITLNSFGMMFALENSRYDIVDYLCGRRVPKLPEHNQCWLYRDYLDLLVDAGIVVPVEGTDEGGMTIAYEEPTSSDRSAGKTEPAEVVLCNIVHPHFNDGGYTSFGDVAREQLGQQCQYASRYVTGRNDDYPNLGEGLRFKNLDDGNYHAILIHRDDIDTFVQRYKDMEHGRG